MQLNTTQPRFGQRQTRGCGTAVAVLSPTLLATPHRACTQPARGVLARSSKATTLAWDDLANALPRANPEKRVLQDINFFQLVRDCPDWEALQRLEGDLRERYDRQPSLAMAVLLRTSEVVDVEAASEEQRRAVVRVLNGSIAPFIIAKGVYSYKATALPPLLAALAALQYNNARLNAVLLKLLESAVDSLMLAPLCSSLCSAAALGLRMGPDMLDRVVARLDLTLKFATAEDVGNLATALASYTKLPPSAGLSFLSRLAATSQPFLEELSGEQLVDLLVLFVRQDFPLTNTWVSTFQTALLAGLPGLTRPRSYAALLFSLAKGSLAISEGFLSALLNRLVVPAAAAPAARAKGPRGSGGSSSLLSRMRPGDLAVVAAVLSIYGYTPQPGWCEVYVEALESRAPDMDAKQVVTVIDTCVELGISLSSDLMDELLAVAEGDLVGLAAARLQQLLSALEAASHQPDGPWMKRLTAALVAVAGRSNAAELTDVVAVLSHAPYAYAHDSEATASVLAAVKARAAELKGLDAATRGSIQESLKHLHHPGAAAFADSLAPQPAPAPAPAPAAAPAPTRAAAAAVRASAAATSVAGAASPSTGAASVSASGRPVAPAARAAAPVAAPASSAPARPRTAAAPPPPPQQQLVGSTRTFGRRRSIDEEEEEEEEEEEVDEEDEVAARRQAAASAGGAQARRAASVPPRALPPPPPPAFASGGSFDDGGFVASTRTSRRR